MMRATGKKSGGALRKVRARSKSKVMSSQIVVVTGANRGIGLEMVRQLARAGARVILTARKAKAGEAAVAALEAQGLKAQFHPLDVTKEKSVLELRDFVRQEAGHLDVLINNAGVIDDADRDAW